MYVVFLEEPEAVVLVGLDNMSAQGYRYRYRSAIASLLFIVFLKHKLENTDQRQTGHRLDGTINRLDKYEDVQWAYRFRNYTVDHKIGQSLSLQESIFQYYKHL